MTLPVSTRAISRPTIRRRPYTRDLPPVRVPADPHAWFWSLCDRCAALIRSRGGVLLECGGCVLAAREVWPGVGPVAGEASGA
jgi:hypothetical protein